MRKNDVRHVCAVILKGPLMGQPVAYDACKFLTHVLRMSYACRTCVVWALENHMAGTHNLVAHDMRKQCVSNAYDMFCRHMSRLRSLNRLRVQKKSPSPGALWTPGASSWTPT